MPASTRPNLRDDSSPEELADMLGVSTQSVYRWIWEGTLTATKVRGRWCIAGRDVRRLLAQTRAEQ